VFVIDFGVQYVVGVVVGVRCSTLLSSLAVLLSSLVVVVAVRCLLELVSS